MAHAVQLRTRPAPDPAQRSAASLRSAPSLRSAAATGPALRVRVLLQVLRRVLRRLPSVLSTACVTLAAVAFLLLAIGPHVLGYRTATMLTGSMAPGINPGDVVVSVPKPAAEVAVGDVISYHIPVQDHRVETHRVIEVTRDANGRLAVVTKGDANTGADPWVATLDGDTVWQTQAVVPHVGSWIRALRAPLVQGGVFWGALGAFVLIALWRIWSPERDEDLAADRDEHRDEEAEPAHG
ncbi:signal peptidase, endoplasmic reticulum-type [Pedococcus dokdonensis]|uniref:Signal peptidase I n=1 Tax=Pedococcus dokdonensis TaxID=443156 RepID=A0A1H0TR86_9MICO|nr:signal peptidase I [Pedococcus dokdonensis]SDP56285.1 signal peptidase, endoplasmic reticulum-type [Pedococcus dokdonensis]